MASSARRVVWLFGCLSAAAGCSGVGPGNGLPIADAGPDRPGGVLAGDVVLLDGSASRDPDGDALTYSWSLVALPAGSAAELNDPAAVDPSFVADQPGTYTARLTVDDGSAGSAPDEVTVTVARPPPVVSITAPEALSVVTASPVTVTGTVDDTDATLAVNGAELANAGGSFAAEVALLEGGNTVTVVARNGAGEGRASVEVILNTSDNPALTIMFPGNGFLVGEAFDVGAPLHATQVAVAGVIKVNTRALTAALNKPTVAVNGVPAEVALNLFFGECTLFNPYQCWRFTATVPLDQGSRTITAVGADVLGRTTTVGVDGIVDSCRVVWKTGSEPPPWGGEDPEVLARAGRNHELQRNRCHEIDGCSIPGGGQLDDNPLPLAVCNAVPVEFGRGEAPPKELFVHGLASAFDRPCNKHDVCYQTCEPVAGLSAEAKEEALKAAMHACNQQQYQDTLAVCRRAYPNPLCPDSFSPACLLGGGCLLYLDERKRCFNRALFYLAGVEAFGFAKFQERQEHYCAR